MRVLTKAAVTSAIQRHGQWQAPLSLWLATFDRANLRFESFDQIRSVWLNTSGWNTDRIPFSRLKNASRKGPLDIYIFDIKKNECRVITWINPLNGTIYIKEILPHSGYDKWWKHDVN